MYVYYMQTVPDLSAAFRRVYLPVQVHAGLQELLLDRSMGAQQLSARALEILAAYVENKDCSSLASDANSLFLCWLNVAFHLTTVRPSMKASIVHAVTTVFNRVKPSLSTLGAHLDH